VQWRTVLTGLVKHPLHHVCSAKSESVVEKLLQHGALADKGNRHGETPLHISARLGNDSCLGVLLSNTTERELNRSLARRDAIQMTPLMHACASGSTECVRMLLQQSTCTGNGSIDCTDSNGNAALHYGATQKHIVKHLLTAGANPLLENNDGKTPLQLAQEADADNAAKLLQEEENPNSLSQSGVPRLLESVRNSQYQAAEALLRRGADASKKGEAASFPLHEAAALPATGSGLVHLLFHHNASPSKVDDNRRSAVHVAASGSNVEAVQALISSGASINKRDETGQTPLHAAARAGSVAALRVLLSAGAYRPEYPL
jgi:ankyrin repeat protein